MKEQQIRGIGEKEEVNDDVCCVIICDNYDRMSGGDN